MKSAHTVKGKQHFLTLIAGLLIAFNASIATAASLINIQCGSGQSGQVPLKTGFAAVGLATNDFWNFYTRDGAGGWMSHGELLNLKFSDGTRSGVDFVIDNAAGAWGNGHPDPMFSVYLYPSGSGNITMLFTNLQPGLYDVLAYAHGALANENSTFSITVGTNQYPAQSTVNGMGWNSTNWSEGMQYVRFRNVRVAAGTEVLRIVSRPQASSLPFINGLQLLNTAENSTNQPPVITSQPQDQSVPVGSSYSFAVTTLGTEPLFFQWFFNQTLMAGETNASLALNNLQATNAGRYSVVVSNAFGQVLSREAQLTLITIPLRLINVDFGAGNTTSKRGFAGTGITADDFWNFYSRDASDGSWKTSGQLTGLRYADNAASSVSLQIENAPGAWGNGCADPMYLSYLYPFNGNAITVTVTNLPHGVYDVYIYGHEPLPNGNSAYTLESGGQNHGVKKTINGSGWESATWQEGMQFVVFRNVSVAAIDNLRINITPDAGATPVIAGMQIAEVQSVPMPPAIISQPKEQRAVEGMKVWFAVSASGTPPLYFQWQKDGVSLEGATNAILELAHVQATNAGAYSVQVSNALGMVTSSNAMLTMRGAPSGLINIDFGAGTATTKSGFAATGINQNDFWNFYSRDDAAGRWKVAGEISDLMYSDGFSSGASLRIANAPGAWGIGSSDPMYHAYLYPLSGGNITITIDRLPPGDYDLYIYGHGAANDQDSWYELSADGTDYGSLSTINDASYNSTNWTEGVQFVVFKGVTLSAITNQATITIRPKSSSHAIISGMQIASASRTPQPPVIVTQPAGQKVTVGGQASFTVRAAGSNPLAYQWLFENTAIAGATGQGLVLTNVQTHQAGRYAVAVTNELGSVTSAVAVLSVIERPSTLINLDFGAGNESPKSGFAAIGQSPNDFWNLYTRDDGFGGYRRLGTLLNLKSADGVSSPVSVTVSNAPGAWGNGSTDPMFHSYLYPFDGGNITVTVSNLAAGAYDFYIYGHDPRDQGNGKYEVLVDGIGLGIKSTSTAPGWNSTNWQEGLQFVLFTGVQITNTAQVVKLVASPQSTTYAVISGMQISQARNIPTPPSLIDQPASLTLIEGKRAAFHVTAIGSTPMQYQWSLRGVPITGATNTELVIARAGGADAGEYSVVVSNAFGCATSQVASLEVNLAPVPPAIVFMSPGQHVSQGGVAVFEVTATGSAPLHYQWYHDGVALTGVQQSAFTNNQVTIADAGKYHVVVSNAFGKVTGPSVSLWVVATNVPPVIGAPAFADTNISVGSSISLAMNCTGSGTLTYQWYFNSYPLANATNSVLILSNAQPAQSGTYHLLVRNDFGQAQSVPVVVNVQAEGSGGFVNFSNYLPGNPAPVYDVDGVTRLAGTAFMAQLYGGATSAELQPIGGAAPFRTGLAAGIFLGGGRTITVVPAGTPAYLQVRCWGTAYGSTYEQALANGGKVGESSIFTLTAYGVPSPPVFLTGLQSFELRFAVTNQPPQLSQMPQDLTLLTGKPAVFGVEAFGSPVLSFQWYFENQPIAGANAYTLVVSNTTLANAGKYHVVVTNELGAATSRLAGLTVTGERFLLAAQPPPANEGDLVTIPVSLVSSGEIGAAVFMMDYNPDYFASPVFTWNSSLAICTNEFLENVPGKIRGSFHMCASSGIKSGEPILGTLTLRARSVLGAVSTPINLSLDEVHSTNGEYIAYGNIAVGCTVGITPTQLSGDNNGNNRLDIGDAIILQRIVTGLDAEREWDILRNDLNQNGTVDGGEVLEIMRQSTESTNTTSQVIGNLKSATSLTGAAKRNLEAGQGEIFLSPARLAALPGQQIRCMVGLTNRIAPVAGLSCKILYPSTALRLVAANASFVNTIVPAHAVVMRDIQHEGVISFAVASSSAWPASNGAVLELLFEVKSEFTAQYAWALEATSIEITENGYNNSVLAATTSLVTGRYPKMGYLAISRESNGALNLFIYGDAQANYLIESSSDLKIWLPSTNLILPSASFALPMPGTAPNKFFRVIPLE